MTTPHIEEKWKKNAKYLVKKLKQDNYKDAARHLTGLVASAVQEAHQAGDKEGYERGKKAEIDEKEIALRECQAKCRGLEQALDDTIKALTDNK